MAWWVCRFDGGVTNRTGARHGPREIRNQSSLIRKMNQSTGIDPHQLCSIADVGDVWVRSPFHLESSLDEIQDFFRSLHAGNVAPVSAGGDHSVTLPIMRAIASERPVGMVHFDAHCDTGDDYGGSRFHHGAPFRRAVEEGLLAWMLHEQPIVIEFSAESSMVGDGCRRLKG